jgi:hypothetical protein
MFPVALDRTIISTVCPQLRRTSHLLLTCPLGHPQDNQQFQFVRQRWLVQKRVPVDVLRIPASVCKIYTLYSVRVVLLT